MKKTDFELINDKNSNVRYEVAERINIEHLPMMMNDEDNWVRQEVAKRIWDEGGAFADEHLPKMMNDDEDFEVRREIAERISIEHLPKMMNDKDYIIRWEVAKRIGSEGGAFAREHLPKMMNDKDSQVRYEVAKRMKELK